MGGSRSREETERVSGPLWVRSALRNRRLRGVPTRYPLAESLPSRPIPSAAPPEAHPVVRTPAVSTWPRRWGRVHCQDIVDMLRKY